MGWLILFGIIYVLSKLSEGGKTSSPPQPDLTFRLRANWQTKTEECPFDAYAIEFKGMPPVAYSTKVDLVVSFVDVSDPNNHSVVLSPVGELQEESTVVFQFKHEGIDWAPGRYWDNWLTVCKIAPEWLKPPRKGRRTLRAILRLIDSNRGNPVKYGFLNPGIAMAEQFVDFVHVFESGYIDEADEEASARVMMVQLSVAMAAKDNEITEDEKLCIRRWISRTVDSLPEGRRNESRAKLDAALVAALSDASKKRLDFLETIAALGRISSVTLKYEAIGLAADVLAADGEADPEELRAVDMMARELGLDISEVRKITDQRLINLDGGLTGDGSMEALLGIRSSMSKSEINQLLRREFNKWNGRINTLPEGPQRGNAQKMLDLIAEARNKYS